MYPFNFITAVALNQIVIFLVKEQSNLLRKYGSSRRIFNDVQGCTVLFLYFPDVHKTDSAAATVLVGGVPGLTKVLKELHIKGIPTVRNLQGGSIFVMTKSDSKTAHIFITNGNHGIFQQIRQKVGKVFPGNDIFRHFYNIACDMQGKVDILCQGALFHICKKRI